MEFKRFATQKDATPFFLGRAQAIFDLALDAFKAGKLGEVESLLIRGNNLSMEFDLLPVTVPFQTDSPKDPNAIPQ
jgi:hypothetical protein